MAKHISTGFLAKPESEKRDFQPVAYAKLGYELLEAQKDDTVLDIGCKGGWLEFLLSPKVKKIVAVDTDEAFIKENIKINRFKNVEYAVADASQKLPFADNSFDKIAYFEVLEHLPPNREKESLVEMLRVLKPNGKLVLTTPHANWLSTILDPAWWLIKHRHYRADWLANLAKEVGFSQVVVRVKGRMWHALSVFLYYPMKLLHIEHWTAKSMPRLVQREFDSGEGFVHIIFTASKK